MICTLGMNGWLMCMNVMMARLIQATVMKFDEFSRLLIAEELILEDMSLGAILRAMYSRYMQDILFIFLEGPLLSKCS